MSKQKLSRTPSLDMDKCTKAFQDNKFDMIIYTAARARELSKKNRGKLDYFNPTMSALFELQDQPYERKKV